MSQKKQIFKLSILRKFLSDVNSCVSLVQSTRLLALPPFFLNDMKSGIFYLLNNILKKYDRSLDGIVIGYQNVKILMDENTGIIPIGSAETEVNVSVEFYIFQPKIGNTLEGVINKKSNNHIGCLVHRYFNATILKPEDVEYEDWNCKDFDVNDKIIFKVKDLDFTGLLPLIEGIINNEDSLDCDKSKIKDCCDLDVHKSFESKILSKSTGPVGSPVKLKKCKIPNEEEEDTLDYVSSLLDTVLSEKNSDRKKKKKSKREKNAVEDVELQDQRLVSTVEDSSSSNVHKESKSDDSHRDKKKKKRKKKEKEVDDGSTSEFSTKKENNICPEFILQKFLHENADDDFLKPMKRKKDEEPILSLNKISESPPQKDELFYSTQLESTSVSKLNTSCSPILKGTLNFNSDEPKMLIKEKIKGRKRKAEDSDDAFAAKKVKKERIQVNGTMESVDELLRKECIRVKEESNKSKKVRKTQEQKDPNVSLYEKLINEAKTDIALKNYKDSKKKKKKVEKFKNGSIYDVETTPEKSNLDKSLFSDSEESHHSPKKNENGVASAKMSLEHTLQEQSCLEEGKKLKSDFEGESVKESTKRKTPPKEREESLYEKLLREARSRIGVREDSPPKKKRKAK